MVATWHRITNGTNNLCTYVVHEKNHVYDPGRERIWLWVKTLALCCSHQNSLYSWMFAPANYGKLHGLTGFNPSPCLKKTHLWKLFKTMGPLEMKFLSWDEPNMLRWHSLCERFHAQSISRSEGTIQKIKQHSPAGNTAGWFTQQMQSLLKSGSQMTLTLDD